MDYSKTHYYKYTAPTAPKQIRSSIPVFEANDVPAAPGEGPIDAAFNAIERIAGAEDTELISYNITAVTEGTDALGEARVKLKSPADGSVYTGRGVSTDVIKASIKAYLNAINTWTNANKK